MKKLLSLQNWVPTNLGKRLVFFYIVKNVSQCPGVHLNFSSKNMYLTTLHLIIYTKTLVISKKTHTLSLYEVLDFFGLAETTCKTNGWVNVKNSV